MSQTGPYITDTVQYANGVVARSRAQLTPSSLLARNATLNVLAEGWMFLVLVLAMPKLVQFLGESAFGLFSLAWVVIGYLTFLDIGVNRAATKFVSEHLAAQDGDSVALVVQGALLSNMILGVLGGIAIALACPYLVHFVFKISPSFEHEARLTFYAVALAIPSLLVQGIFRAVLSSYQRFGWINVINAAATAVQWGIAGLLASEGRGVAIVVFSTVATRILATVTYGVVLARILPPVHFFRGDSVSVISKLVRFGTWVTVSQVISPVLVYFDRMLIASFVSLGAVTLYTVPYEVMTRLRVIPSSMMGTLYPAFSERGLDGQEIQLQRLYERSIRYLSLLLLPGVLFLVVLGSDVMTLWMGHAFARETVSVLEILAFGVLANGIAYAPYNMLQAVGRPDLTGKFHLFELPFYLVLCFALIPHWGIAGAALASTLRFVCDAGLLFWAVHKYCKCSLKNFWASSFYALLFLSVSLGVSLFGIRVVISGPWLQLGAGVVLLLTYFAGVWVFVLDQSEKPGISAAIRVFRAVPSA